MKYLLSWWKRKLSEDELRAVLNKATMALYSRLTNRRSDQLRQNTRITISTRLSDPDSYIVKIEAKSDYRLDYVFFPSVLKLMLIRYGYAAIVEKGSFNATGISEATSPSINITIRPFKLQERKILHRIVQSLRILAAAFSLALVALILFDAIMATFL
jgi:hypothetical protein